MFLETIFPQHVDWIYSLNHTDSKKKPKKPNKPPQKTFKNTNKQKNPKNPKPKTKRN